MNRAAVDGVDCLWVGHFDLSCSLGIPGQFEHRDFLAALDTTRQACAKHHKAYGRLVPTVDDAVALYQMGVDFICYSGDVWALQQIVSDSVREIRRRCAALTPPEAAHKQARRRGGKG